MIFKLNVLGAACLGAGIMYLTDPDRGRRRRALLYDQLRCTGNRLEECLEATWSDVRNRARGFVFETFNALEHDQPTDEILVERVRARLGRNVSHAAAIEVSANDGCVTLRGPVLAAEVERLLSAISAVKGVISVENQLDVHPAAANVAALQGGQNRAASPKEQIRSKWSPATRLFVTATGLAVLSYGWNQRFSRACIFGALGLGLVARAVTNTKLTQLLVPNGRLVPVGAQRNGRFREQPAATIPNRASADEWTIDPDNI